MNLDNYKYTLELQSWSPRQGHDILLLSLESPILMSEIRTLKDTELRYQNGNFKIVGIEFFAVADDREYDKYNLLVREIKDDT